MEVVITPDGTVAAVDAADVLGDLGWVVKRRVATVEPVRQWKRIAFGLLRRVFGEEGRVAAWTRTWRGPWKSTILATGDAFTCYSRDACVRWERLRLERVGFT